MMSIFTHEPNHMLTKRNIYAWLEISRAPHQNTQVIDLMLMYMKDFDDIMKKSVNRKSVISEVWDRTDNAYTKFIKHKSNKKILHLYYNIFALVLIHGGQNWIFKSEIK